MKKKDVNVKEPEAIIDIHRYFDTSAGLTNLLANEASQAAGFAARHLASDVHSPVRGGIQRLLTNIHA